MEENNNNKRREPWTELEQRRRRITQEGPSSAVSAAGITVTDSVLQLVESMLEHPKPEYQPDSDHHQNDTRA